MDNSFGFIIIDGQVYRVKVLVDVKESADFLDKYANRVETGDLDRELIGVYFNFSNINFEPQTDENYEEFERLWDKLTEPEEFHEITIANFSFRAYFNNVSRIIYGYSNGRAYRKNMSVNFTSKKPARS